MADFNFLISPPPPPPSPSPPQHHDANHLPPTTYHLPHSTNHAPIPTYSSPTNASNRPIAPPRSSSEITAPLAGKLGEESARKRIRVSSAGFSVGTTCNKSKTQKKKTHI
ncbi:hypothetical protein ACMFMF_003015 [Clarireedia jacksonii]